jgi:predicted TIM-barrel fold metal-dependent hydrolase
MRIDCHNHIIDPARFPYNPNAAYFPAGQEIAPVEQFLHVMDSHAITHALVVGPNSGYDTDNTCLLAALAHAPTRLKGIAVVPNDFSRQNLSHLKSQGIVGIAFNTTVKGADYYQDTAPLLRHLADLDMFLNLQFAQDDLLALLPLLSTSPVRLLIDHCGRPTIAEGIDGAAFRAVLELGRRGRASVKISGYSKFSLQPHPYADAHPFIRALIDAYSLDACLWGSDWPFLRTTGRLDYGPLLQLAERLFPSPDDRQKLFCDTPRRLLGWPADKL